MKGTFSKKAASGHQIEVMVNQFFVKKILFLMEHHSTHQKRAGTRRERTRGEAVLAGGTYNASSQPQHRDFDKKQFQFLKIEVFSPPLRWVTRNPSLWARFTALKRKTSTLCGGKTRGGG